MRPAAARRALTSFRSYSTPATAYSAPSKPGANPAYDQAVAYIAKDRQTKLDQISQLSKSKDVVKEDLELLEVQAWVNDPETRWRAQRAIGDMSKPVYRHLAERAWRKNGDLAILMQRITQMSVTPDVLPSINPSADIRVRVAGEQLVPGVFVQPAQTREGVEVTAQVYHADERLYTLVLVDPDVPDELNRSFTTYAHWLIPNIPLSSTNSTISASALLPFIPPHPQQGTPYHRYTFVLLAQPAPLTLALEALEREGLNVREFVREHDLEPVGMTFFRQKWDKTVSEIYRDVLGTTEPKFGRAPKVDTYEGRPPKYEVL